MPALGGKRLLAAAIGLAVSAFIAWRFFRPEPDPLKRLLGRLPADQALHLYFETDRLLESRSFGPAARKAFQQRPEWEPLVNQVDAVAVSLGESEIFLVAAGSFPEPLLAGWLENIGADCQEGPLEGACALPFASASGSFSLRLVDSETLALADSPDPLAANRIASLSSPSAERLAGRARQRLRKGAFAWMNVNARLLDEAMRDPPESWINLSLIARALLGARETAFFAADADGASRQAALLIGLDAECDDPASAAQLQDVLASLNKLAKGALGMDREPDPAWSAAVDSFQLQSKEQTVLASWRLQPDLLLPAQP